MLKLNQVTVGTTDYDASVDFYTRLGLTQIVHSPPRYARFETPNGETFSIHRMDEVISTTTAYFELTMSMRSSLRPICRSFTNRSTKPGNGARRGLPTRRETKSASIMRATSGAFRRGGSRETLTQDPRAEPLR